MSEKVYTDILYKIDMQNLSTQFEKSIANKGEVSIAEFTQEIVVDYVKKVDKAILDSLYELAQHKFGTMIVIDITQFEKFIKECLPKWQKKERKKYDK